MRRVLVQAGVPEAEGHAIVLQAIAYQERLTESREGGRTTVVREGLVRTTWRVLAPGGAVLDALVDVGTTGRRVSDRDPAEEALAHLPSPEEAAVELATSAGCGVGHRLVTVRTAVARPLYGAGPLREGARALRAGDVDHAIGTPGAVWVSSTAAGSALPEESMVTVGLTSSVMLKNSEMVAVTSTWSPIATVGAEPV